MGPGAIECLILCTPRGPFLLPFSFVALFVCPFLCALFFWSALFLRCSPARAVPGRERLAQPVRGAGPAHRRALARAAPPRRRRPCGALCLGPRTLLGTLAGAKRCFDGCHLADPAPRPSLLPAPSLLPSDTMAIRSLPPRHAALNSRPSARVSYLPVQLFFLYSKQFYGSQDSLNPPFPCLLSFFSHFSYFRVLAATRARRYGSRQSK